MYQIVYEKFLVVAVIQSFQYLRRPYLPSDFMCLKLMVIPIACKLVAAASKMGHN